MRTFPPQLTAVITAATLMVGAACAGGSDGPTAAEDVATARRIVLTPADLPGFVTEPRQADTGTSPLDRCVNGNPLLVGDNPRGVDGDDLSKDDGNVRVQSGALLAVREVEAVTAFSDLRAALESQCLKESMQETFTGGTEPGVMVRDVRVTGLPSTQQAGADAASSRVLVTLERGRQRALVYVDLTVLRRGRVVAGVFTFQMGEPFADLERRRLTDLVARRMEGR